MKGARAKQYIIYRGTMTQMTTDCSSEIVRWEVLKKRIFNPVSTKNALRKEKEDIERTGI